MRSFEKKDKKAGVLAILICAMFICIGFSGCTQQQQEEQMEIKNPTTLVRYDAGDAKSLDPADAYDSASSEVIYQVYDTLITFKGGDTKTFYPSLATNWTISDDGTTYTFYLRKNVKFSNGNDFTAEDVKYSFDRVLTMGAPETGVDSILRQCIDTNSTTVIDDYTVQIKLPRAFGPFISILAFDVTSIVDKDYVEEHGGIVPGQENEWMKLNPMGTGPYMLDHWTRATEIVLNKNPNYWRGWEGKHVDKVVIKYADEPATRILALKNGDADIVYIPYANLQDVKDEKGVVIHPFDSFDIALLCININASNNKYLADGRVREALSYAFDYDTAIETAYNGYATRCAGAIPKGMPFYETQNNGQPYYNYNLTMAEQILDDAGYTKSYTNDFLSPDLYRFNGTTIRLFYNAGNSEREMMAVMFRAALDKIGILSTIVVEGWPQLLHREYTTSDWDLLFNMWGPDYNDPDNFMDPLMSSTYDIFNTGYENETIDEKILEGKFSSNSTVRAAAYKTAYDVYIQEPPYVFQLQRQYIRPYGDWVQNYSYNPVREYYFYDYYKAYE